MREKNYTITFFGDEYDYYEHDNKKYYLLIIENDQTNEKIGKYIQAENNRELVLIKELIRNDRLLLIEYLMRNQNKRIDNLVPTIKKIVKKVFNELLKECE